MANIGIRPTVSDSQKVTLEVHFFDFDQDLYDHSIVIWFLKYLREEQKFSSLEHLQKQLKHDEASCRDIINGLNLIDEQS